ncbi:MAG: hypothetical protein JST93_11290 [Acidobacteria bacterium]|nr:hypothetical protein [Acidobacteriota bacterium]
MDKNERQIEGILKLLKMGAKQFALDAKRANRIDARLDQISEDLAAMTGKMNILIDAQIRADERLGLLEKKANGRGIKPARKRPGPKQ